MSTCQWFFTALSVLPGKSLAINAHLLPYNLWAAKSLSSSSSLKALLLILGSNWLNHLNLQLLPTEIENKIPKKGTHNSKNRASTYYPEWVRNFFPAKQIISKSSKASQNKTKFKSQIQHQSLGTSKETPFFGNVKIHCKISCGTNITNIIWYNHLRRGLNNML